jgi:ACS family hexuronate transporter-like MFS transporter
LRWFIVSLLFLATVINYVDRQTLSVLAPMLRDQFHMSNTDYSRIVFAFLLAYMIMQSGSGRLMDWLGTRTGMALTVAWWSVAAMLHAAAGSVLSFGVFRFLLGMGEAGNWPGGVKAVSEWFPAKERAFATGFFNSGSTVGAIIAPPLVTWIALRWDWQTAFLMTGSLGFFWVVLWLVFYRSPQEHPWLGERERAYILAGQPAGDADSAPKIRWVALLGYRQVWGLVLARMMADPVWWFYVFWLPEYLKRERNFSMVMIGYFAWIPFLTADIGCLTGGAISGWLIRRGCPVLKARKIVMSVSAALMLSGIPAVLVESPAAAIALISLATFSYSNWAPNVLTLPADLFPKGVVASVSGLSGTGAALGGMLFTLIIGKVVDHFSYVPVFVAAGILPLIAASFILRMVKPLEPSSGA